LGICYAPIDPAELDGLTEAFGQPEVRTIDIPGDEYLFATRLYRSLDRRAEVVLAVERPQRRVLLHRKGWYEASVYRLLSGGVNLDETVADAMARELREETSLLPLAARLLGVLNCIVHYDSHALPFASYVFHVAQTEGRLQLPQMEDICEFREVPVASLAGVAEDLRLVPPPRSGWGHWRALAHDFVQEMLTTDAASADALGNDGLAQTDTSA
jgi:ADP-ribose pyrophosphatase YjhB (NUDIX family)